MLRMGSLSAMLVASLVVLLCNFGVALASKDGLIIPNGGPGNETWYALKLSHPVVLKFGPEDYRMWAYGFEFGFPGDGAPFGRTGYFTSKDGINWVPFQGPGTKGSVLDPLQGTDVWDSGAVGVSDVLFLNGTFFQLYSGTRDRTVIGSNETLLGFLQTARSGVAVSPDGIHWSRCNGPAKNFGAFYVGTPPLDLYPVTPHLYLDGYNASAQNPPPPNGLPVNSATTLNCSEVQTRVRSSAEASLFPPLEMNYHSLIITPGSPLPSFVEYGAVGPDIFDLSKTGVIAGFEKGVPPAFDSGLGVGNGRKIKVKDGEYLMFYEGVGTTGVDAIGLARSSNGRNWTKDTSCTGVPGGPVLSPRAGAPAWDNFTMGTPFPLLQPDGTIYLYYVGISTVLAQGTDPTKEKNYAASIGLAISQPNITGGNDYCNFTRVA